MLSDLKRPGPTINSTFGISVPLAAQRTKSPTAWPGSSDRSDVARGDLLA